jgi:hypothetical protein
MEAASMAQKPEKSFEAQHGKKQNQKLKPYLVQQYLLKNTDEDHVASAYDIIDFLEQCGVAAERRSIYRDIEDINKVMWLMENKQDDEDGIDIDAAEEALVSDENDAEKTIVYQKHAKDKGFYVRQRRYDPNDIRLLAECVYSAKFLSQGQADRLANVVCEFVSKYQAEKIRHDAFLTDRVKTSNKAVLNNISTINDAMSRRLDGGPHDPEKISFQYLKYSISDMGQQVERRKGQKYTVSPYKLLINDGNYYLLAFDDYAQDMRTYRVDRMKNVHFTGEPREGAEAFAAIDLKSYTKRVFSMFGGKQERVVIRFINPLLDAVVDRFGNDRGSVWYEKLDDTHFTVTTQVEVSDQFFGWVLGFGKKAKILEPPAVVDQFAAYLDKVREMY